MGAHKTDPQIQHDVAEELRLDPRVAETDVGVTVVRAVVTLRGTIASWAMKMAAQEAAHRVEGVLDVANELDVRLPGLGVPTDGELAEEVRETLSGDDQIPGSRIRTTVSHGVVTLEGEVDSAGQREEASRAIRNVPGVKGLTNRLVVRKGELVADELQAVISAALQRQAQREAQHVKVAVRDGSVTLTGTVHSWSERRAIVGTVRGTLGVDVIIDELHVGS